MAEFEHRGQENYEHTTLTVDQWTQVVEKAENAEGRDLHLYILRPWTNQQVVTNGSINSFRGNVIEDTMSRQSGAAAIGNVSQFVHSVTGNTKATCYEWNEIRGEWTIGGYQRMSLRIALGYSAAPER